MDENDKFDCIQRKLNQIEEKLDECIEGRRTPELPGFQPQWLLIEEAHRICRISIYSLRKACSLGRIDDCYKGDDGRWRISRKFVEHLRDHGLPQLASSD